MLGDLKKNIQPYTYKGLQLRLIEFDDLKTTTFCWRNRDDVRTWFKLSNLIAFEEHLRWFNCYLSKDNDFHFIVEFEEKIIGQVSAYAIDSDNGIAEIGRFIVAPECRGNGYLGNALDALVLLCAETLRLNHLFLDVFEHNEREIELYKHKGFLAEFRHDRLIRMSLNTLGLVTK